MQIEDFQKHLEERDLAEAESGKSDKMLELLSEIRDLLKQKENKPQAESDKLGV